MPETYKGIPEEKSDEQDCDIKKVSVDVLKDQRELLFSAIIFTAEGRLADCATCWVSPESLVIRASVVVTSESKSCGKWQDQECWRKEQPCRPPRRKFAKPCVTGMNSARVPEHWRIERREKLLNAWLVDATEKEVLPLKSSPC